MPDPAPEVGTNGPAAGCPPSRTGRQVRPCSSTPATVRAAAALGRCVSGPGRIVVVVDPDDTAEVAVDAGAACRRSGRFVVHAGPNQGGAARLQTEVLMALGKHWNRAAEGGDANGARLVRAWLRAEQARELTVLRAHQIRGAALVWLLGLAATEGLVVRLVSPEPLDALVAGHPEAELRSQPGPPDARGRGRDGRHSGVGCDDGHPGVCEDLNAAALPPAPGSPRPTDTVTRRLRHLYDIEAASFATAAILLGCFDPDRLAAARPQVSADAARLSTLAETMVVPEHARALLRAWSGAELFPEDWADDVVASYLTLRLELAQRRTGLELIDPDLPAQVPVCWHCRFDPGASVLTWVMGSRCHEPGVGGHDHDDDVVDR